MPQVKFTEISSKDLPSQALMRMVGSERGRLLRFTDAVLARAETNRNRDEIDDGGITEVAASLPLLAIDIEHQPQDVIGFFTDARNAASALSTDGIIFADRFPQVADDIVSGRAMLSIEADAKLAICSVCGQSFGNEADYCQHLQNRLSGAAVRRLRGLVAVGGGVTTNPAGTNTKFNQNRIVFMASLGNTQPSARKAMVLVQTPILKAEVKLDTQKIASAARAAQRLFATFASDSLKATPQLNTYRPVFSPLLYVENPPFIDEIVNRVTQRMAEAMRAPTPVPVAQATTETMSPTPPAPVAQAGAPATTEATPREPAPVAQAHADPLREEVKQVVAQKLSQEQGGTEGTTVTASASPTSVGLVGLAWDAPTSQVSLKASW